MRHRKHITGLGIVSAGLFTAGIAFAAWTATGDGTGSAGATTQGALTTSDATAVTTAQLYPSATGDLKLVVDNPNHYQVKITSVVNKASSFISSDKGAACTDANADHPTGVTFTNQTGQSINGPADADDYEVTLPGSVGMSNASDNGCQGAVFSIPVTITSESNPA